MDQANSFGSDFSPQADMMGGGSAISFWPILAIVVVGGIVAFVAYKIFFD